MKVPREAASILPETEGKQSEQVPYVIVLIAIGLALWLALGVVLIATPLLIAAVIYALRLCSDAPPVLPDPEKFDQPESREKLKGLACDLVPLILRKNELTEEARKLGIGITNAGRYDQRKKAGRSFNEEIEVIDSRSRSLVEEFAGVRGHVSSTLPNYRAEFDEWLTRRTTLLAAIVSAKIYAVGFCVGLLASPLLGELIGRLMVGHWPGWLASAAFVASLCAIPAFFIAQRATRNELAAVLDDDKNRKWLALIHFWNSDDDTALQEHAAAVLGAQTDRTSSTAVEQASEKWDEALGVPADAPIEDIKAAWKTLMKEYHPDRVQTLGPKLRELAESESKRLNEAYEAALRSKGAA